jgi:flavin-dependent dehydrogenase
MRDLIVVGGGPAGLATAAACARRGLDVLVLERRALPADKACGEGLMPAGVAALDALGALARVPAGERAPFAAVRWIDEDGTVAEARLPSPGLGIRRTALSAALAAAARAAGAEVRERSAALALRPMGDAAAVETSGGEERARLVVAADGLGSALRARAGLDGAVAPARRFGLRRHYAVEPWADAVEVHFRDGVEAYVTPVGPRRVGVALLCEERALAAGPAGEARFESLLARFPRLAAPLRGAEADSALLGAGPLARAACGRVAGRLVLVGDAAGYVDALTGEGLSLAFHAALALGERLPDALARGGHGDALRAYERDAARRFTRYEAVARLALGVARRPAARRRVVAGAARHPALFSRAVAWAIG